LPGEHSVTITVANDTCSTVVDFTIGNQDISANVANSFPANCTGSDGTIALEPANYTYTWSDGGSGAVRTDLPAGTYTVTVLDNVTVCLTTIEVTVEQQNVLEATATIDVMPSCGEANGQATISANGSGSYTFVWSNGGDNATENGLASGTYSVTISDNENGCTAETSFTLTNDVAAATVTVDNTTVSCFEATDATVIYDIVTETGFVEPMIVEIRDNNGNVTENGTLAAGRQAQLK
jgi:hypothetical protein